MAKELVQETLPQERQQLILARLASAGRVFATALAEEFGVSEDSIRRDLRELAAQGLCKRVYGGALPPVINMPPLPQRRLDRPDTKLALARTAVGLVRPGQTVMIDAGSTNAAIAAALPAGQRLSVITNAPDVAQILIERGGFAIQLIGGRIDSSIGAAVGAQAVQELRRLRADVCFPGACAIDADSGLWGMDSEEALFKRAMVECSGETVVVATTDKLGAGATHRIAGIEDVQHLVVEHTVAGKRRAAFSVHGVLVHRAAPETAA